MHKEYAKQGDAKMCMYRNQVGQLSGDDGQGRRVKVVDPPMVITATSANI